MDVKQKLMASRMATGSDFGVLDELSTFFHTAVRQLDVEESKFNIIAETLFRLFVKKFGGACIYVPLSAPRLIDSKFEKYYRHFKSGDYSADQIAAIKGCSRRHVYVVFRYFDGREILTDSQEVEAITQGHKQRIFKGGIGTGKSRTMLKKFSDFFHAAVRQLDIDESKFDSVADQLLLLFLTSFGGLIFYVPVLKRLDAAERWKECLIQYRSGIYSIEKISKLMDVSQSVVYRRLKAMTESERQARCQNTEAAPPFRSK